jgi:hypothetical protein
MGLQHIRNPANIIHMKFPQSMANEPGRHMYAIQHIPHFMKDGLSPVSRLDIRSSCCGRLGGRHREKRDWVTMTEVA